MRSSRLSESAIGVLRAICDTSTEDITRLAHSGGFSFTDLCVRRWAQTEVPVVDAVVTPQTSDEVARVVQACAAEDIALVTYGGGTSVVQGISGDLTRPVVALALTELDQIVSLDRESGEVIVQPGVTGPALERWLQARDLTWGHLPQSWERATVGGYVATRSSGQASTGYGRSDATVTKVTVATPVGQFQLGRGPASAAGPDLKQVFLGSEGAFGVITEVGLRVRPVPAERSYVGLLFPTFELGTQAFRTMAQDRTVADVMRLSDADETDVNLAMGRPTGLKGKAFDVYTRARGVAGGCLAILGWEGPGDVVAARRKHALKVCAQFGGVSLGSSVGAAWHKSRYHGPYLRDDLMDAGYLVETFETAHEWSELTATYEAVHAAVRRHIPRSLIGGHLSHIYATGASLYFTVLAAADEDPIEQWRRTKQAATQALVDTGATITHHHAVGRDHAPWLPAEIGESGMDLLRAMKSHLDPTGIMNPGVLGL